MAEKSLRVAVTGPTGTFGFGLIPLLEADDRIGEIIGIARSPFEPSEHGWSKMIYRPGDVRNPDQLAAAFEGADVVVHLAFAITGSPKDPATYAINIDGTLNTFKAAAAAGAKRFVFASTISAIGFDPEMPYGVTEEWAPRPIKYFDYARQKADLERALTELEADTPGIDLYMLRTPGVMGPHLIGHKSSGNGLRRLRGFIDRNRRLPFRIPMPVPRFETQAIHEDDVGSAFVQCIFGAGEPGVYHICSEGVISSEDIARIFGFRPLPFGKNLLYRAMSRIAASTRFRFVPDFASVAELYSVPLIMDSTKAKQRLGWTPKWNVVDTYVDTLVTKSGATSTDS
ncbi:NAD-dependent epimerase/dehydratase family protein [Mycobacterium paraffinicum]|uniref:NAD-dependent epimerase/dehydratase family protein n=1 Tax=Mycobacterium paraffinicum TaxID=53378 RepID=UPI000ADDA77E|nr:NAD-dependent epimerase/dehydratase family protein [Mycobacterium paraffinicum]